VAAHVQIQFTIDDRSAADAIVDGLLADRLVACGQRMGPVTSRYWWEGSLHHTDEWLVLLKTRADLASRVVDAVLARHPYDTPEVVAVAIDQGAPSYLAWIDAVTTSDRG
jgi:periplasmic divalent cation tolerance protein